MNANRYTKPSELNLRVARGERRSVIADSFFTAPFKLSRPFYDERERLKVMLIFVSAGIMAGDDQSLHIELEPDADVEISSQSFEKVHKMEKGTFARRHTNLRVGKGATLTYAPLPVIPFAESAFIQNTDIELADESSELFFGDIVSCGRVSHGEYFDFCRYQAKTEVRRGGERLFWDNLILRPSEMRSQGLAPDGFCLLEGYTHQGTVLIASPHNNEEREEALAAIIAEAPDCDGGVTSTDAGLICVRALANGSEPLLNLRDQMRELVQN